MVMVNVVDHVSHCYSNADGDMIYQVLTTHFAKKNQVMLSFKGIDGVSTSFVNSAFIELLNVYNFEYIRTNLKFVNSSKQINEMIKRRFDFEVNQRKNLVST